MCVGSGGIGSYGRWRLHFCCNLYPSWVAGWPRCESHVGWTNTAGWLWVYAKPPCSEQSLQMAVALGNVFRWAIHIALGCGGKARGRGDKRNEVKELWAAHVHENQ